MHNSSGAAHKGFFRKHAVSLIMAGLLWLIGWLLFSDSSKSPIASGQTIDPYVLSTKGKTLIFREKLITVEEKSQEKIFVGDRIKTLDSTATIFWPDGSITRLSERSSITIREMRVKTANEQIQIDFSLEQGKTWSNVIHYLYDDSYFHERYNNDTALAAVRGTVFEMNLDKNYIHTVDHGVSVEDSKKWTSVMLSAGGVMDVRTGKALLANSLDTLWNTVNRDEDISYLEGRFETFKNNLSVQLKNRDMLSKARSILGMKDPTLEALMQGDANSWSKVRDELVTESGATENLMNLYQQYYALPNTGNVLKTKMELRDLMIETASGSTREKFVNDFARSTLYDIWEESTHSGSVDALKGKLDEYMKAGADPVIINGLMNGVSGEEVIKLNATLETMKKNLMEKLSDTAMPKDLPFQKTTENVTRIGEGWFDRLLRMFTP